MFESRWGSQFPGRTTGSPPDCYSVRDGGSNPSLGAISPRGHFISQSSGSLGKSVAQLPWEQVRGGSSPPDPTIDRSSNGRTADSDSADRGSNPRLSASFIASVTQRLRARLLSGMRWVRLPPLAPRSTVRPTAGHLADNRETEVRLLHRGPSPIAADALQVARLARIQEDSVRLRAAAPQCRSS